MTKKEIAPPAVFMVGTMKFIQVKRGKGLNFIRRWMGYKIYRFPLLPDRYTFLDRFAQSFVYVRAKDFKSAVNIYCKYYGVNPESPFKKAVRFLVAAKAIPEKLSLTKTIPEYELNNYAQVLINVNEAKLK